MNRKGKSISDKACVDMMLYGSSLIEFTPDGCRHIPMEEVTKPVLIAPNEESAKVMKDLAPDITVIVQQRLPKFD